MKAIHICTKKTVRTKETGKTEKKAVWMAGNTQYVVDAEQNRMAGLFRLWNAVTQMQKGFAAKAGHCRNTMAANLHGLPQNHCT